MRRATACTATIAAAAILLSGATVAVADPPPSVPNLGRVVRGPDTLLMISLPRPHAAKHGTAPTSWDFDGDGVDDLALTADTSLADSVYDVVGDVMIDGSVVVTYSSVPREDVLGSAWPATRTSGAITFGTALTAGDFDGDGYDDLAIGDADDSVDGRQAHEGAGAVWIVPGSAAGLQLARSRRVTQDSAGVPGKAERADWFGFSVAAGDVDADGYDDLAVGAPNESVGRLAGAGAVTVLLGGPRGLSGRGARTITQNTAGLPGAAERGDEFGWSVAIGRVGKDRFADVVIGAPRENFSGNTLVFCADCTDGTGGLTVLRGSSRGVTTAGAVTVGGRALAKHAKASGTMPDGTFLWRLGESVAIGDLDGDSFGDVVVGDGAAQVGGSIGPGAVIAVSGGRSTVDITRVRVVNRASAHVSYGPQTDENFGAAVAVGDLTGDGRADVVVGSRRAVGGKEGAGAVTILRGSKAGLTGSGSTTFTQAGALVPGAPETADAFGGSVRILSTDGTGRPELLVASEDESLAHTWSTGMVSTFSVGRASVKLRANVSALAFTQADWVPWIHRVRLAR
ncbi:hypothetical protein [Cellulomonas edaphi]|uniref:VCBS repeat-containing protein n=1 Tax=Cellulomonas edaphi TaxID=3053468 RepID=A0ABT7S5M9_9CELL|nr:hypothetical protein [Cellulomons edaphi]MDM7830886.1 hypothetical protein [Cellulomons edaphi]